MIGGGCAHPKTIPIIHKAFDNIMHCVGGVTPHNLTISNVRYLGSHSLAVKINKQQDRSQLLCIATCTQIDMESQGNF